MAEEAPTSCANCGKAEEQEAKLKSCNACKLVKYCGRDCQIAHRPLHKQACRKREAELHDEALFRPPPKGDDCPICFLLLPYPNTELGFGGQSFYACCGKRICTGCSFEHQQQNLGKGRPTCPFCRADMPFSKEFVKMMQKRADANDADAIYQLGDIYLNGDEEYSITKDVDRGVMLLHRAAELGNADAYRQLGALFYKGDNGVIKDQTKAKQYYKKAAMAGCVSSRFLLGCWDAEAGRFDRATKHWLIGARFGDIRAVNIIQHYVADSLLGDPTRDHYAQALRGYQQYVIEVRSDQRDRAAESNDEHQYLLTEYNIND
jgi:hypothetical protein